MDMRTNYRQDYITPDAESIRSASTGQKSLKTEPKVYTRRPMNGISQTSFDYRSYPKHRPPARAPLEPFQSQINLGHPYSPVSTFVSSVLCCLNISWRCSLSLFRDSQYHVDYPGYDAIQHPRPPAAIPKDEQRPYIAPTQKMDTMTVTQVLVDTNLGDELAVFVARFSTDWYQCFATYSTGAHEAVSVGQRSNRSDGKHHYVSLPLSSVWTSEISPSLRWTRSESLHSTDGEISRFDNVRWFIPRQNRYEHEHRRTNMLSNEIICLGPRANAFIPEMQSINLTGKQDHRTNYRMDYPPHGLSLCAAKAYAIANKKETTATPVSAQ
jgi:hypothetical protein